MSRISRIVQRLKEHKRQAMEKNEDSVNYADAPTEVTFGREEPEMLLLPQPVPQPQPQPPPPHGWDFSPATSPHLSEEEEVQQLAKEEKEEEEEEARQAQQRELQRMEEEQRQRLERQRLHATAALAGEERPSRPTLDPRLARRQQQLQGDPFAISCPYSPACGLMEARDLPAHAAEWHAGDDQAHACSICLLSAEDKSLVERKDLLQHLGAFHKDCIPSWADDPLESSLSVDMRSLKVAGAFVEDVLNVAVAKECPICFDEFERGDAVYRMDCWCLFHQQCAQAWFDKVGNCRCPVHASE